MKFTEAKVGMKCVADIGGETATGVILSMIVKESRPTFTSPRDVTVRVMFDNGALGDFELADLSSPALTQAEEAEESARRG